VLVVARTGEWIDDMTKTAEASDEDILTIEVSDEALESAAHAATGAAMSLPAAPTVSILVVCCGNDSNI
jgi:hypothetical protein